MTRQRSGLARCHVPWAEYSIQGKVIVCTLVSCGLPSRTREQNIPKRWSKNTKTKNVQKTQIRTRRKQFSGNNLSKMNIPNWKATFSFSSKPQARHHWRPCLSFLPPRKVARGTGRRTLKETQKLPVLRGVRWGICFLQNIKEKTQKTPKNFPKEKRTAIKSPQTLFFFLFPSQIVISRQAIRRFSSPQPSTRRAFGSPGDEAEWRSGESSRVSWRDRRYPWFCELQVQVFFYFSSLWSY